MSEQSYTISKNNLPHGDKEIVPPAFASNGQALCFLALVVFILILPWIITKSGLISRYESYEVMPENMGAYSFIKDEIFNKQEDIDILFAGASTIFEGIDTPQVQKALSNLLGRPAQAVTFGYYHNSIDVTYMQIRDLLERRRVRFLVLAIPRMPFPDGPSKPTPRFIRYSDDRELFEGLPVKSKVSFYACSVLRTPRDLLTIVRPNLSIPSPFAKDLGADKKDFGDAGDPSKFKRITPPAPLIPAAEMIYSSATAEKFQFTNEELTNYQNHYLEKLVELLKRNKVPLMMINIPQSAESNSPKIIERQDWSKFDREIAMVGIPPAVLFAGLSEEDIKKLYYDKNHFNTNGNEFFTRTILPAILEVYQKNATKTY